MIFDSHVHVRVVDTGDVSIQTDALRREMERCGIEKSCYMPDVLSGVFFSREKTMEAARVLDEVGRRYEGTFYPLVWLNTALPAEFLIDVCKSCILNGNVIGVKLWIEVNAANTRLDSLCAFLEEHDIPVLFHSWYKTVSRVGWESTPADIASLARRFPKLRILCAHLTGFHERGVQDIKPCANVAIDTSGCYSESGIIQYAHRELGADRILFGSDYPGRDMAAQYGRILSLDAPACDIAKISGENALHFFRKGK
ncbi:MAG: amidohydrolase family protein [Clostridiaceae bacterium]|nr:amidohydrolase family protein [Clostridiaceae bacterium]